MKFTTLLSAAILAFSCFSSASAQNMNASQKLRYTAAVIEQLYVDTVNMDHLAETGIIAMLKELDPHSQYSNREETKALNEPLQGNFSGIGIQFIMSTDTLYVIQVIPGGPSEKVGLIAGDRILAANDSIISGVKMKNQDVIKRLRGPKGSKVKLTVMRKGVKEPIDFMVTRDDIPIYSVDAVYMAAPEVGYIKLTRFAEDSGKEVAEAIKKLKKQGMKHLILDLEDNGGGYLNAATDISEMLLPSGKLIVSTKGDKARPFEFYSDKKPVIDGRLVVMVNQYSASASAILSGAVQDHDRGLIVGRRTFGKGLVQRPIPFPDGSMIRLTTARYYTPSGRCIQKPYAKGKGEEYMLDMLNRYNSGELWHADSIHLDKSTPYYTLKNHRTVYGGGGIMPDVFVPADTSRYSSYYRDLVAKGAIMKYVVNHIEADRAQLLKKYPTEEAFAKHYQPTEADIRGIIAAGEANGVPFKEDQWQTSRELILAIFKGLMTRDLYENGIYVRSTNPLSNDFNTALDLINDPVRYHKLLKGDK